MESTSLNKSMEGIISIPTVPGSCKFWMIRTKKGFFFNEFITNGFIALGWNALLQVQLENFSEEKSKRLKKLIKDTYGEKSPGSGLNKCKTFINEVKAGDIAMIAGKNQVAFAIIGDYYEVKSEATTVEKEKDITRLIDARDFSGVDPFECPYAKRRSIELIKVVGIEDTINPYLYKVLVSARQSLVHLDKYSDIILSSCYDAYIYRGSLNLVFHVQKENNISSLDFSKFILYSSEFLSIKSGKQMNITAKSAIRSPGDIIFSIAQFASFPGLAVSLMILWGIISGVETEKFKIKGIVPLIEDHKNRKRKEKHDDIALRKETAEAVSIELDNESKSLSILDQKLELNSKIYESESLDHSPYMQQQTENFYKKEISMSSVAMKIKPIDKKIIDFGEAKRKFDDKNI